jgi:hypothetical protein
MTIRKIFYGLLVMAMLLGIASCMIGCTGFLPSTTNEQASGTNTQYGSGYRFNKNGWIYLHIQGEF